MPTTFSPRITGSRLTLFFSIRSTISARRGVFGDGERLLRHHLIDPAAMLVDEIGGRLARPKDEFQPAAALALGADFTAANESALRHDADELAAGIDHGKALTCRCSIKFAASSIVVSGATVTTDRVMI